MVLLRILLVALLPSTEAFLITTNVAAKQRQLHSLLASVQNLENTTQPLPNQNSIPRVLSAPSSHTAVILNLNARSVNEKTAEIAKTVFPEGTVYVTTSHEDSQVAMQTIMASSPPKLIIPVGGDGTLTSCINDCVHELQKQHETLEEAMKHLPVFGYIPLGTGNGVGSVVGCRVKGRRRRTRQRNLMNILEQLKVCGDALSKEQETEIVNLPMLHIKAAHVERLCFFAGVGFDSMMLDDFKSIKQWSHRTGILRNVLSSVSGYCVALIVKTLPKAVRNEHTIQVSVSTHDEETLWIDHRRGDFVVPVSNTLFEGSTGILAAGTSPFYGGGLRLFPFARLTLDKMHLRIGRIHPMTGFFNIPGIFAGSYRDKSENFGVLDFLTSDVTVRIAHEFPFQHSGESIGEIDSFRMTVAKTPVRFLSLMKERR